MSLLDDEIKEYWLTDHEDGSVWDAHLSRCTDSEEIATLDMDGVTIIVHKKTLPLLGGDIYVYVYEREGNYIGFTQELTATELHRWVTTSGW